MKLKLPIVLVLLAALALPVFAEERSSIPDSSKWNFADLYASEDAWSQAKDALSADIPKLAALRGSLGQSPDAFFKVMALRDDLAQRLVRLSVYASMLYDVDTRVGRSQQMDQQAQQLQVEYGAASSWINPEVLALGAEKVRGFLKADPRLAPYRQPLEDTLRRAPHTLDAASESIVAQTGLMAGAGGAIRGIFTNADMPYPEVTLSDGQKVTLDAQGYTKWRAANNREDRMKVFKAFWTNYGKYTRTIGTTLNSQVQAHVFTKNVRKFDSCLESALFNDAIPVKVYSQLLDDVHRNLPVLHRYLKLRQKMMGLDKLGYEDLYAPIVGNYDRRFTPQEAMDLTLKAVAPLGKEYADTLRNGFANRWVDWFPTTGKRSGAYSTMVFGVHPFQLQNFTGLYDEVSTLAHESGHSMHSYLSAKAQPFVTSDYPIFVAEVASTLNENLLAHRMLDDAKTDDERLFLLGSTLDGLRLTLFRQTSFAEFELRVHEMVEKGEPLTGENLNALYLKILRQYYGHDQGIVNVDELYASEWAYIPHFYYNFYVYQYATSILASTAIADGIRTEAALPKPSTARRDGYIKMLSAGSSRYAYDLLKEAGVDLATPAPFDAAMREMNRIMDQIEEILARKGKAPAKG